MLITYLSLIDTPQEKNGFRKLYEKYSKLMYYAAKRILENDRLAEEAVQEAFLRIAKNFSKVGDPDKPAAKRFVLVITENAALTLHSKEAKHTAGSDPDIAGKPCAGEERREDATAAAAESREAVEYILDMPQVQQSSLFLHTVYGYKYREIAALLGISEAAARKHVQRARSKLEDWMGR